MKRLLILLLLALPLSGQEVVTALRHPVSGGGGGPTIKQSALSTADGTYTATLPSHASGGVSCALAILATTTTPTIANTAGWSWGSPAAYTADAGGQGYGMWVWCTPTLTDASSDTVTVTSGAFHGGIAFLDLSNTTAIDNSQGAGNSGTSTPSTGSFSLTGSSDMVFALGRSGGGLVVPTGYTSLTVSGTGFWGQDSYDQISYKVVTVSSVNVTWGSNATGWDAFGVAIK